MARRLDRRRFGVGLAAAISLPLAGCIGDDDEDDESGGDGGDDTGDGEDENGTSGDENGDDGNGDDGSEGGDDGSDEAAEDDDTHELVVTLENDEGEPVSYDVIVTVDPVDDPVTEQFFQESVSEGTFEDEFEGGEYVVGVEPDDLGENEFDAQEEELTLEGDEELSFVLEGALGDEAYEESDEDEGEGEE